MEIGGGILGLIALITWLIAAAGGALMLGIWARRGGVRSSGGAATRLPPGLVFGHFLLAAAGLVVWIIYLVTDAEVLSWVSFVVLLVVAALGATMFVRWAGQTPGGTDNIDGAGETTAERHFPVPVVVGHGLFAVGTAVLVILVALGIGGS